jgi:hypothetical protein
MVTDKPPRMLAASRFDTRSLILSLSLEPLGVMWPVAWRRTLTVCCGRFIASFQERFGFGAVW